MNVTVQIVQIANGYLVTVNKPNEHGEWIQSTTFAADVDAVGDVVSSALS